MNLPVKERNDWNGSTIAIIGECNCLSEEIDPENRMFQKFPPERKLLREVSFP